MNDDVALVNSKVRGRCKGISENYPPPLKKDAEFKFDADLVDVEAAPTDGLHRGLLVFETANLQCEVQD